MARRKRDTNSARLPLFPVAVQSPRVAEVVSIREFVPEQSVRDVGGMRRGQRRHCYLSGLIAGRKA